MVYAASTRLVLKSNDAEAIRVLQFNQYVKTSPLKKKKTTFLNINEWPPMANTVIFKVNN